MKALVFRVGTRRLALDAAAVAGVARRPALTRVPGAPAALAGVAALGGRATPVIALGEGGGEWLLRLSGEPAAALAVDAVEGLGEAAGAEPLDLAAVIAEALAASPAPARTSAAAPAVARRAERELAFLEFALAGQRFGVSLPETRAVLPAPAQLLPVPEADSCVLGLAPHGDGTLPIVAVSDLLGLPRGALGNIVVVEIGGALLGLAVERVLGVLRVSAAAVSPAPAVLNRGRGEARIAAVARTPAGLTLILAPDRLFDEATTLRLQSLGGGAGEGAKPAAAEAEEILVVFRLGEACYALPAACVEAVGRPPATLSAPPNAPAFLAGVMTHRGEVLPLVDQRRRFATPSGAAAGAVLFVRGGGIAAGLLVDSVERLARVGVSRLERAPALRGDAGALFTRVAALEGEAPLLVADPAALLEQARRDLLPGSASHP